MPLILRQSEHPDHEFRLDLVCETPSLPGLPPQIAYRHLLYLDLQQALSIAGGHSEIEFRKQDRPVRIRPRQRGMFLQIERVATRALMEPAWRVRIGSDLLMRSRNGRQVPQRLNDEQVRILQGHGVAFFEPGEPNWMRRSMEEVESRIVENGDEIAALERRLARAYREQSNLVAERDRLLARVTGRVVEKVVEDFAEA